MELAGARGPSACARARGRGRAVSPPCPSPLKIGTCRVTSAQKHIGCLSEVSRGRKLASLVNGAIISTPRPRPPHPVHRVLPGPKPFSRCTRHILNPYFPLSYRKCTQKL